MPLDALFQDGNSVRDFKWLVGELALFLLVLFHLCRVLSHVTGGGRRQGDRSSSAVLPR